MDIPWWVIEKRINFHGGLVFFIKNMLFPLYVSYVFCLCLVLVASFYFMHVLLVLCKLYSMYALHLMSVQKLSRAYVFVI